MATKTIPDTLNKLKERFGEGCVWMQVEKWTALVILVSAWKGFGKKVEELTGGKGFDEVL